MDRVDDKTWDNIVTNSILASETRDAKETRDLRYTLVAFCLFGAWMVIGLLALLFLPLGHYGFEAKIQVMGAWLIVALISVGAPFYFFGGRIVRACVFVAVLLVDIAIAWIMNTV